MRYYHILMDGVRLQVSYASIPVQILAWSEREAERVFRRDPQMCGSALRRSELKDRSVEVVPAPTSADCAA